MKFFLSHIKEHILLYFTVFFALWLFFFHLDYNNLSSWDEAWYGAIAQDIFNSGDFMNMTFNGAVYYDHPPFGFWLMALSMKLFGINEFSVRFTSAVLGIGSSVLIYLFAYELFKKKIIGFAAALILNTSVWYVIRARSGNLDATFLFFYILTLYTAQLSAKNFRWFIVCMASFGALILTKTLVGVSSLILIIWLLIPALPKIIKDRKNLFIFSGGIVLAFVIIAPWYVHNLTTYPDFYRYHFIHIGMRDRDFGHSLSTKWQWELPIFYLHMGVRKWYKLWLVGTGILIVSILLKCIKIIYKVFREKQQSLVMKNVNAVHHEIFLIVWNAVILVPFLTTDETHIWHLIPVYAPLSLIIAYSLYFASVELSQYVYDSYLKKYDFFKPLLKSQLIGFLFFLGVIFIAALQVQGFYYEAFPVNEYTVDEVAILKNAKKYDGQIFIDRDYIPIAVFYTNRLVREHSRESDDIGTISKVFAESDNAVLVIRNGILENYQKANLPYLLREKNNSFSIISEEL